MTRTRLTLDQLDLLRHAFTTAKWELLWIVDDPPGGRSACIAGQRGGYGLGQKSYQISSKDVRVGNQRLTWGQITNWAYEVPRDLRARIRAHRQESVPELSPRPFLRHNDDARTEEQRAAEDASWDRTVYEPYRTAYDARAARMNELFDELFSAYACDLFSAYECDLFGNKPDSPNIT